MKNFYPILATAALMTAAALGRSSSPALAQPVPPADAPPSALQDDRNCGTWKDGTWIPNGSCPADDYHSRVSGTITSVKGHLVTVQQTTGELVINDQPALDSRTTGRVAVGRQVVAAGYWRNGTFYATVLR